MTRMKIMTRVLILGVLMAIRGFGQEIQVPVEIQYQLILKSLGYVKTAEGQNDGQPYTISVLYQSKNRTSFLNMEEFAKAYKILGVEGVSRPVQFKYIDLSEQPQWIEAAGGTNMLYITPLRAVALGPITEHCNQNGILTVSSQPLSSAGDIVMGFTLVGDRPRIQVHQAASQKAGIRFSAAFMQIVQRL